MCACVGLRVLWLPSVTCVGHVLSLLGWGRRRSPETAEHKGETQTGRQAAGRPPARAPQAPTPWLLKVEGVRVSECALCLFLCVESLGPEWKYSQDALGLDYAPRSFNKPSVL